MNENKVNQDISQCNQLNSYYTSRSNASNKIPDGLKKEQEDNESDIYLITRKSL